MHPRLVNSFNLLAVVLIGIGIAGACSGGHMVFDPGRASTGKEWIIYLVAGALMLINGFLPAANPPDPKPAEGVPATAAAARAAVVPVGVGTRSETAMAAPTASQTKITTEETED